MPALIQLRSSYSLTLSGADRAVCISTRSIHAIPPRVNIVIIRLLHTGSEKERINVHTYANNVKSVQSE